MDNPDSRSICSLQYYRPLQGSWLSHATRHSPLTTTEERVMKSRPVLLLAALGAMFAFAALSTQKKPGLLILDWSRKAAPEDMPVAFLIELGVVDQQPTAWSGRARVTGARVIYREGYRFREGDKLVEPDGWVGSSH